MGQRFWACHNHWVGHSHFGTEATKLLRPSLFWANFEVHSGLTDWYKNLVMTMWVIQTLFDTCKVWPLNTQYKKKPGHLWVAVPQSLLWTTTLFGPHLVQECHFRAPWSRANSKKWRGTAPLRTPPQGGTPPLKIPPVVYILVPRRGEKPLFYSFLYSSIWLNFTIFLHFLHKLWCLKQVLLIMTPKGVIRD